VIAPPPFAGVAGRDVSRDRPLTFDAARCYYEQRECVAAGASVLRQLIAAVDWTNDLTAPQWAQWYSVALGFQPDLILELGRGRGNSTALFCQAAGVLGRTNVVSLCNSGDWTTMTAPKLASVVPPSWFEPLDARMTDILTADYAEIIGDHRRVLLLWDAHGFEIAEVVLGEILPRLLDRDHLVIMHDIADNRYGGGSRSYGGQPLWKGSEWQQRSGCSGARVNVGWMHALQDQVIAIADFSARNDLTIESADHEFATFFAAHPSKAAEMTAVLGEEFFSTSGQWAFFSLTGKNGPFEFPAVAARRAFSHSSEVVLDGADRLPTVVATPSQPWSFASAWRWKPRAALPAGANASLCVRLHVENGSIGIGLLGANGRDFTVRRAVAPGRHPIDIHLPVADIADPGQLVISTWAAPTAARVRVDQLTLVW
jgi:hypothetical protein